MKQGPFPPDRLCCPAHHQYYDPLRLPLGRLPLPGSPVIDRTASRRPQRRGRGGPPQFPGQPSDRSTPTTPEGSSTSAPGPKTSSMAFAVGRSARHPLDPPKGGAIDDACSGFACAADRPVDPAPLRTRPLNHARGLHYRGPRRLPGPDSHRLAALNLSLSYVTLTSLSSWRPNCWAHRPVPPAVGADRETAYSALMTPSRVTHAALNQPSLRSP